MIGVDWSYYNKPEFEAVNKKYLPVSGEGETMASQIVTAINKLIYKWYNDGDVYDNTYFLDGWMNDLSSYANWLALNVEGADIILCEITIAHTYEDYEHILKDLADSYLDGEFLAQYDKPKQGTIYKCEGRYQFSESWDDDEGEW